jgi:hypothetical protein
VAVLSAKEAAALAIIGINEIQLKGQGVTARIIKGLGRAALRLAPFAARAAPTAARAVLPPITGPAALAAGYYYTGLSAQDQARRDFEASQNVQIPIPLWNPLLGDMPTIEVPQLNEPVRKIRKASNFNKAISAGMKSVRSSKFMGKKGSISNPKKAFATVTKTVSSLKKGRKRPTKGVRGTIARAVRRYI